MKIFVLGDVEELTDDPEAIEKFKRTYGPIWKKDVFNWFMAQLLREGKVTYIVGGKDATEMALEAIENTMKILQISWEDVEELVSKKQMCDLREMVKDAYLIPKSVLFGF